LEDLLKEKTVEGVRTAKVAVAYAKKCGLKAPFFEAIHKLLSGQTSPEQAHKENHINISPKAPGSSLVVLGPRKVAYADFCGSGAETAARVMENQRMTLLFCNLEEGPPKILRLHGMARQN